MKFRRHGRYKRNQFWNLRRAKGTVRKIPDGVVRSLVASGEIGTIDRVSVYDPNQVPTWMDKRQFRRWRRKQKKAARTPSPEQK